MSEQRYQAVLAVISDGETVSSVAANPTFWIGMMIALSAAFGAAFPVNRYLCSAARDTL